jgi:hypothetical protein
MPRNTPGTNGLIVPAVACQFSSWPCCLPYAQYELKKLLFNQDSMGKFSTGSDGLYMIQN